MPTNLLTDPHTLIIFTTAPAGLGHLRVTQALWEGLPKGSHSFILGLHDKAISSIHRALSNNRFLFNTQLFVQHNHKAESVFTNLYRDSLRKQSQDVYDQLYTLITSHQPKLKEVIIVATHFGLAHQIAEIRHHLIGTTGVHISLHVIVTDDTFQPIWAVENANRLCVPSQKMADLYKTYFEDEKMRVPKIDVQAYPVSPQLAVSKPDVLIKRRKQLDSQKIPTRISIPISGASTQLDYLMMFVHHITQDDTGKFQVNAIASQNPLTSSFGNIVKHLPNTRIAFGATNQETVEKYTQMLTEDEPITIEVTKPSEQAYKCLYTPKQRGGVLLLFTPPVGKQEEDNLQFLSRHNLLPNPQLSQQLARLGKLTKLEIHSLLIDAKKWRAICLPKHPREAASQVYMLKSSGILKAMLEYKRPKDLELSDKGVEMFWKGIC